LLYCLPIYKYLHKIVIPAFLPLHNDARDARLRRIFVVVDGVVVVVIGVVVVSRTRRFTSALPK